MEPTQSPIQWLPGALSLRVKQPGCEIENSPPPSTEAMNGGAIPPFLIYLQVIKYRDKFAFTLRSINYEAHHKMFSSIPIIHYITIIK
jgi:hypothetical protein